MSKKRQEEIINLLHQHLMMKINDFCVQLNASPATIRRDLSSLENAGLIKRISGGALLLPQHSSEQISTSDEQDTDPFLSYKKAIAKAAVAMVKPGDTIFIDSGSTNNQIAELLTSCSNISIVTNSIEIAYKFISRKDISVIVCGGTVGEVSPEESVVGPLAEKMISEIRANICFLGTSGVDNKHGITDPYLSAARIKERMIENSLKIILVTDHSKFGKVNKAFVCSLDQIDHLITSDLAPEKNLHFFKNLGVSITLVGCSF